MVDLFHLGLPRIIGVGVLELDDGVALVDPGPEARLEALGAGLAEMGHSLESVRAVLLTHIPPGSRHGRGRDRAGGTGRNRACACGGRATHGRPVTLARVGRADLRRPDGRAVGRVSACAACAPDERGASVPASDTDRAQAFAERIPPGRGTASRKIMSACTRRRPASRIRGGGLARYWRKRAQ